MQLTDEQEKVHTAFRNRVNAAIEAYAGSGKSTTIISAIKQLPKNVKVALIYFNKSARMEAKEKLAGYDNVAVWTNHTVAFAALGSSYDNAGRLLGSSNGKTKRFTAQDIASLLGLTDYKAGDHALDSTSIAQWAMMTVNKFAASTDREIGEWNVPWVPAYDDVYSHMKPVIAKIAREIWEDKLDRARGIIPVTHDDYLKMWAIAQTPKGKSAAWFFGRQVIAVDEFQDTNPIMWEIFSKHKSATLYGIGDPYQAVYGFRGAQNYLGEISKLAKNGVPIPCESLHLTRTFRFGGDIVDEANKWLTIAGATMPLVGNDSLTSTVTDEVGNPDAILCRTNSGVITAAIGVAAAGRTFSIANIEATKALAEGALSLYEGKPSTHQDLLGIPTWDRFMQLTQYDPSFADLKMLAKLIDEHGAQAIIDLLDSAKPLGEAECEIRTAHGVKGLEWDKVQIGSDFERRLNNQGEVQPMKPEDIYLAYVAVTRAKSELGLGSLSYADDLLAEMM